MQDTAAWFQEDHDFLRGFDVFSPPWPKNPAFPRLSGSFGRGGRAMASLTLAMVLEGNRLAIVGNLFNEDDQPRMRAPAA
jgi:hypothetical protein